MRAVSELGNAADARGMAAGQVADKASEGVPVSLAMWTTSIYTTRLCAAPLLVEVRTATLIASASSLSLVLDLCLRQDVLC
jgi:hypothetical protein